MTEREPLRNLSRGTLIAVVLLSMFLLACDVSIAALGYVVDGWRGAAILTFVALIMRTVKGLS